MKKLYIKPKSTAVAVKVSEIIAGSIVDVVDNDDADVSGDYTPEGGGDGDNDARRDLWSDMW